MIYVGLYLAAACCCGILTGDKLPVHPAGWLAAMAGFVISAVVWHRRRFLLYACLLLALFCCGAWRVQQEMSHFAALPLYLDGHTLTVNGTIREKRSSYLSEKGKVTKYIVSLEEFTFAGQESKRTGRGNLYVTLPAEPEWDVGSRIRFTATLRPVTYYRNEGMFDARHRDQQEHIIGSAYHTEKTPVVLLHEATGWQCMAKHIRDAMTGHYQAVLEQEQAYLLSSLVFGGHYDELPQSLLQSFSATGLIHILSVSGSHVSLLLAVAQMAGGLFSLRRKGNFILSAVAIVAYGGLAEFTAPVVRSVIMGLISAFSMVAKRDYTGFHALALAVLAMVLYQPFLLFDLSFRLSCGASAGIVLLSGRVSAWLRPLPKFLRDGLAVGICAQLFLIPLLFYYFHSFPMYALLANLTVGPVLDVTIILGLAAAVCGNLSALLAYPFLKITAILLAVAVKGNQFIAMLPGSRLWSGAPSLLPVAAYYLGMSSIFLRAHRKILAAVAVLLVVSHVLYTCISQGETTVYLLDIGNDRATCAIYSDSSIYLWYNKSRWSSPGLIACVLTPALRHQGIFHIDCVFVGGDHPEQAAAQLSEQFRIGKTVILPQENTAPMAVTHGAIPYFIVQDPSTGVLPAHACLEIRSLRQQEKGIFPKTAASLLLLRDKQLAAGWEEWTENADYYGVPYYSPYVGGAIVATYKKEKWDFSYHGGGSR